MDTTYPMTIITVCYNSAKTIRDTLNALTMQTRQDFEYIIIDGCSRDNTIAIIEEYMEFFGDRFMLLSEPDDGLYYAMNKALSMAKGNIIGIVNSDDWLNEDTVAFVLQEFSKRQEMDILCGGINFVDINGEKIRERFNKEIKTHIKKEMPVNHPATFVKKCVYDQIGFFDTTFRIAADYDFICRAYNMGCRFEFYDKVLSNFRTGGLTGDECDTIKTLKNHLHCVDEDYHVVYKNFGEKNYKKLYSTKIKLMIKYVLIKMGIWNVVKGTRHMESRL